MVNYIGRFFNSLGTFLNSGNEYYRTGNLGVNTNQLNGTPEFIKITNENAYEIMKTTSELDAVISRRGRMLSLGVWKHEKSDSKGNVTNVENSEFVRLLENPNPLMNGNDLLMQWNENMVLYGNNYEFMLKPFSNSAPRLLNNLQVNNVEMKVTGKLYKQQSIEDIISYYKIKNGTDVDKVEPYEINHTRVVNSNNPIVGESPLKSLYMDISNIRGAKKFRNVIITKMGALGVMSSNSKGADGGGIPLTKQEREKIEKEYRKSYGIGDEQSKIILTDASLKWQATTYPTKDMLLFEEVDAGTKKIIDALGMDENIFSTASTYENKVQALRGVFQTTIAQMSEEISMNRTRIFGLDGKTEWMRLDYSHIPVLQENLVEKANVKKTTAETISILANSGLTPPEAMITAISEG